MADLSITGEIDAENPDDYRAGARDAVTVFQAHVVQQIRGLAKEVTTEPSYTRAERAFARQMLENIASQIELMDYRLTLEEVPRG